MRLVIQRVKQASVTVNGNLVSKIGPGILILLGLQNGDNIKTAHKWAEKSLKIKLWPQLKKNLIDHTDYQVDQKKEDEKLEQQLEKLDMSKNEQQEEKDLNLKNENEEEGPGWKTSVQENNFEVLVVSQFTLYTTWKGNRPDFHLSMQADQAKQIYEEFIKKMKSKYVPDKVQGGAFQEYMQVDLTNDGPVTMIIEDFEEEKTKKNNQQNNKNKEMKDEMLRKDKQNLENLNQ